MTFHRKLGSSELRLDPRILDLGLGSGKKGPFFENHSVWGTGWDLYLSLFLFVSAEVVLCVGPVHLVSFIFDLGPSVQKRCLSNE